MQDQKNDWKYVDTDRIHFNAGDICSKTYTGPISNTEC